MYADDTVVYVSGKSKDEIEKKLTDNFARIADWLEKNDLIIKMRRGKTECMLFGTTKRIKDKQLDVKYRHRSIVCTDTYKYLGIKLDPSLNLHQHFTFTYKKVEGRLCLLKMIRAGLNIEAALTIYKTMIIPLFTYCSIVAFKNNTKIEKFEKRTACVIQIGNSQQKNIPTISLLGKKRICIIVYDCISENVCSNFKNYFKITSNKTRNRNNQQSCQQLG